MNADGMELLVRPGNRERTDLRDLPEHRALPDTMAKRAKREMPSLWITELKETPGLDRLDLRDPQEEMVKTEWMAETGIPGPKEKRASLVDQDIQGPMGSEDLPGLKDSKGLKEIKGISAHKEKMVPLECQESMALTENQAKTAFRVIPAEKEMPAYLALPALLVLLACLEK